MTLHISSLLNASTELYGPLSFDMHGFLDSFYGYFVELTYLTKENRECKL